MHAVGFILMGENSQNNLPVGHHSSLGGVIMWNEDDGLGDRCHASANVLGKTDDFVSKIAEPYGALVCLDKILIFHALASVGFHNGLSASDRSESASWRRHWDGCSQDVFPLDCSSTSWGNGVGLGLRSVLPPSEIAALGSPS